MMRFILLAACCSAVSPLNAQGTLDKLPPELHVKHNAGDSVQPAYEGWRTNPDGTISMWFGYYNRNLEERVNIPVGANNRFDPPGIDRRQPAFFYPGFHQFVFRVDLPKDWDKEQKLVWTLTANGVTLTANGWLAPGYEVDQGVMAMNLSPGGNAEGNEPPAVTGPGDQTVEAGKPLQLAFTAKDDGLPKARGNRASGVRLRVEEYRGPGEATFEPANVTGKSGEPAELRTGVVFDTPGVYWLRATGFDGQLEGSNDIKVTVTPAH